MSMYRLAFREPPEYTGDPAASAVMLATNSATPSVAAPRQNLRNMTNIYPSPRGATTACVRNERAVPAAQSGRTGGDHVAAVRDLDGADRRGHRRRRAARDGYLPDGDAP